MPPDIPAIETHGLGKRYPRLVALRAVDLCVPQHTVCGFLGPNGAGKTTTIKLLLGLTRPTQGGGRILGHDILRESAAMRTQVGYLPQDPRFPHHMTPREVLRFVASFFPERRLDENQLAEALALVGLERRADVPARHLSGGERQRLGIAQAMVHRPAVLILDEPAASLDPAGRRDILDIIARLRTETTILFSTHILDDVQRVSDRVAILREGELVAQAPVPELLARGGWTRLEDAFFGLVRHAEGGNQ